MQTNQNIIDQLNIIQAALDNIRANLISDIEETTNVNAQKEVKVSESENESKKKTKPEKINLEELPGPEGYFDGKYMVTAEGESYEVPANYAAKSKLVYGDTMKLMEIEGKPRYKQITKIDRMEVTGILHKQEQGWFLLTDSASYKISDTAAEFSKVEENIEAVALIPRDIQNVPFAALDRITKPKDPAIKDFAVKNTGVSVNEFTVPLENTVPETTDHSPEKTLPDDPRVLIDEDLR